jgi:indole-3-glycerol phosphate synthase
MSSILDDIFRAKREELAAARRRTPIDRVKAAAASATPARDFVAALKRSRPAIIAEVKRASPSKGDILPDLDPVAVARDYRDGGAACISVLTDRHFKGSLEDLRAVRAAVDLPLLRKDFIFDEYQLYEARAAGADCVLLIAAMLSDREMDALSRLAHALRMSVLVEAHDDAEFARADALGGGLIGINNRDLRTFVTDLAVSEKLLNKYQGHSLVVAESGIAQPEDIARLYRAGARAFLIGEAILATGNPRERLASLMQSLDGAGERA